MNRGSRNEASLKSDLKGIQHVSRSSSMRLSKGSRESSFFHIFFFFSAPAVFSFDPHGNWLLVERFFFHPHCIAPLIKRELQLPEQNLVRHPMKALNSLRYLPKRCCPRFLFLIVMPDKFTLWSKTFHPRYPKTLVPFYIYVRFPSRRPSPQTISRKLTLFLLLRDSLFLHTVPADSKTRPKTTGSESFVSGNLLAKRRRSSKILS